MIEDDDKPRPRATTVPAPTAVLEAMSIAALREYVAVLEAEIARARATVAAKERARDAAGAVFRN